MIASASLFVGHDDALGQKLGVREQEGAKESVSEMPPQHLAHVAQQDDKDRAIAWGEAQDGIAVGVGAVRTSVKSPIWPIIDAYLENRGTTPIGGVAQGRAKFLLELDGQFYAENDLGGILAIGMKPGTRYGPIAVETKRFRRVQRLASVPVRAPTASAPVLTEGGHTLRLHYKLDRLTSASPGQMLDLAKPDWKLIPSPSVTINVSILPYPEQEAVATIARELRHADFFVRGTAALAAGDLRLSGCRDALVRALQDMDDGVRRYSAESLGEIGGPVAIEPVRVLLKDADMGVRLAAAASLVKLGEAFNVAWVAPIIKSKHGASGNAIWLVRRHGGDQAVPTLIRCLDLDDPSVNSYYNYTLVWQIAACGGPELRYHHDFEQNGTPEQVLENRKVLAQLQDWLRRHGPEP